MEFVTSIEAARTLMESVAKPKWGSYGTVVYEPEGNVVDFEAEQWPAKHQKKVVCSRIFMVANWTDARFALVGGNANRDEDPLDTLNREFLEEIGSPGNFKSEDYLFSVKTNNYCKHM
jgi:8-oxo-dGTP pyrophosphatase MutT (NUDIX family)